MAGFYDGLRTRALQFLFGADGLNMPPAEQARYSQYAELLAYQRGQQRRQIKAKDGQADDNLIVNWCGLVIERGISMLFGEGIDFDLPGEGAETPADAYLQAVLDANKQGILLHRLGQYGGTLGTCYVKILPDHLSAGGTTLPKLVALNPAWMEIETLPHDMDEPVRYTQRYTVTERGEDVAHKIVTERNRAVVVDEAGQMRETGDYAAAWTETHYISSRATGGRWVEQSVEDWPYPFAPIHHWQNLPDAFSCYGQSDLADILPIQDRYNFNVGNISKIVRYHAHPKTWMRGSLGTSKASWGADELLQLQGGGGAAGAEPMIANLEMASDLASSREFTKDLREALFTVTRTTDPATIKDTVGALTNFGLRVLFKDELHKVYTKRTLYGDGLLEVVRRVLLLAGMESEPGEIVWPDPLPVNETEQTEALTADIGNGLVSKQTASGLREYDWDLERERIADEQQASDDLGATLLRQFSQGQGGAPAFGQRPAAGAAEAPIT
jgi:hypothetical protein